MLNRSEISNFNKHGFLIKRMFVTESYLDGMQNVAINHLENLINPIEFEADLNYPGAPDSKDAPGGKTSRRLLQAYAGSFIPAMGEKSILGLNLRQLLLLRMICSCHNATIIV